MANNNSVATRPPLFLLVKSSPHVFNSFVALSVLNIILSISATLGNTLIFIALRRESCFHPPSRLLILNLVITDLCVGLISQPLAALHSISIFTDRLPIYQFTVEVTYITSAVLSGVSLFILTFISVDRLLALSLGMRYRQTVTAPRVRRFVIFFWAVNIANGFARFLRNRYLFYLVCLIGIFTCVIISTFCYAKICHTLCAQQAKIQNVLNQGLENKNPPMNMARYKKTVSSALWVHLTLLICYLPYSIVSGLKAVTGDVWPVAEGFTATLIFFNSSLNPVLYYWRIREVRHAVKKTIRQYRYRSEQTSDTGLEWGQVYGNWHLENRVAWKKARNCCGKAVNAKFLKINYDLVSLSQ